MTKDQKDILRLARIVARICRWTDGEGRRRFSDAQVLDLLLLLWARSDRLDPDRMPLSLKRRLALLIAAAKKQGAVEPEEIAEAVGRLLDVPPDLLGKLAQVVGDDRESLRAQREHRARSLIGSERQVAMMNRSASSSNTDSLPGGPISWMLLGR